MTLYRNLGPIKFQSQTHTLQIFSNQTETLILQFKALQTVNFQDFSKILNLYSLILKKQDLLQIYYEKGKPYSILVHNAIRVGFQNINIDLLCRIIKELVTSILHCSQIVKSNIGQLSNELFLQINGQLKYLYFPIEKVQNQIKCFQQIFQNLLQFIQQFKNEKQVSHRLLFKKIMKCKNLQQILQETDYFFNVYTVKHSNKNILNPSATQSLFASKSKVLKNNYCSQNPYRDFNKNSNQTRRKYQIFKKQQPISFTQTFSRYQNTWRKNLEEKDQSLHNSARTSFRPNSHTIHLDIKVRNHSTKNNMNNSIFKRVISMSNSQKLKDRKISNKKKGNISIHSKMKSAHIQPNFDSFIKNQPKNKIKQHSETIHQSIHLNESIISKNIQSTTNLQDKLEQKKLKNMVHKSLQKWKNKQSEKQNFYNNIKSKVKQKQSKQQSTHIQSSRKFDLHTFSKQSTLFEERFINTQIEKSQNINKNTNENQIILQKQKVNNQKTKNSYKNISNNDQLSKKYFLNQKKDTSLQQIDFSQKVSHKNLLNPIITDKNEPAAENIKNKTNNSDESQTQRIQYSKKSIKNNPNLIEKYQHKKTQIQFIATCVVSTSKYLQKFQAIFWQLPMFFFYKKFYQQRLKLSQIFRNSKKPQQIQLKKTIDQQNAELEKSLIKLLKIAKRKTKKNYEKPEQINDIQKTLNLDYSNNYQIYIKQYLKLYLGSLIEATNEYPQLIMHQVQIMDSLLICFGKDIDVEKRNFIQGKEEQIKKYYQQRLQLMEGLIFNRKKIK